MYVRARSKHEHEDDRQAASQSLTYVLIDTYVTGVSNGIRGRNRNIDFI